MIVTIFIQDCVDHYFNHNVLWNNIQYVVTSDAVCCGVHNCYSCSPAPLSNSANSTLPAKPHGQTVISFVSALILSN